MSNLPKKFLNLKRISIQIVSIINNNKMKGYNMLSPEDIAEDTQKFPLEEAVIMGQSVNFTYTGVDNRMDDSRTWD